MAGFFPYLNFNGNCREAFTWYHEIFGGQLDLLTMGDMPGGGGQVPAEQKDLVMHAALTLGEHALMGSDDPNGTSTVQGMWVNYTVSDVADARRVFEALSDGGEVTMSLQETFWSPGFGMCVDRFGVQWMVNVEAPTG